MSGIASENDPNLAILTTIAEGLGGLCESLVFIGGCAAGLLVTATQAQAIRVTRDVDVVAEVTSVHDYHEMEEALRKRGFEHDRSENAPIGRWVYKGIQLDLMPSQPGIVSSHNRWYPVAVETARATTLPSGLTLRLITAPVFLATKLEAFKGRGKEDYLSSHDLEDIVTIVDGRPTLLDEVRASPKELKRYLAAELKALLSSAGFVDAVAAHLPGDQASQARLPIVLQRLRALADLPEGP
jgi:predicted nucleotidyltransferase